MPGRPRGHRPLLNRLLAGLALSAFILPAGAAGQWVVGAQAGLAAFAVAGQAPEGGSYGRHVRVLASGLIGYRLGTSVVLRVEPGWVQKGAGVFYDVEGLEEPVDSLSLNLDYVSVPVVAQVFTPGGRGFVTGGFEIGVLSSAVLVTGDADEQDVKGLLESADLSWTFGAGGLVRRTQPEVSLELRYSQSLSKAFEGSADMPVPGLPSGLRSSGFQLMAGVSWRLGGDR
jgi:hypothetical protein